VETAFQNKDTGALTDHAHTLKASSAVLGAQHLSDLARQMEKTGQAADLGAAAALLPSFLHECDRVQVALSAIRDETASGQR
jgi:HPt (histidine-containing phosphotransfer) domain-containing protein